MKVFYGCTVLGERDHLDQQMRQDRKKFRRIRFQLSSSATGDAQVDC